MRWLGISHAVRGAVRLRRRFNGPLRPTWDERMETFATFLHHYGTRSDALPIRIQRRMLGKAPRSPAVDRMRFESVSADGVPGRWFHWDGADPSRVVFYLHGGGYYLGSIDSHRDIIARLCIESGATGFAIDYRLAPEHPFPAQLDDARAAYRWLLDRGVDPAKLVVAGDSAGGGLTFSLLVALRDANEKLPAAAITFSPWLDLEATSPTMRENIRYDYVSARLLRRSGLRFAGASNLRNPLAAPIHADVRGLPPLLIQAGAAETLLDDSRNMAEKARAAGVDVTLEIEPDMIHVWHSFASFLEPARAAIARAGAFARKKTT